MLLLPATGEIRRLSKHVKYHRLFALTTWTQTVRAGLAVVAPTTCFRGNPSGRATDHIILHCSAAPQGRAIQNYIVNNEGNLVYE